MNHSIAEFDAVPKKRLRSLSFENACPAFCLGCIFVQPEVAFELSLAWDI